jgi:hypothetical protein
MAAMTNSEIPSNTCKGVAKRLGGYILDCHHCTKASLTGLRGGERPVSRCRGKNKPRFRQDWLHCGKAGCTRSCQRWCFPPLWRLPSWVCESRAQSAKGPNDGYRSFRSPTGKPSALLPTHEPCSGCRPCPLPRQRSILGGVGKRKDLLCQILFVPTGSQWPRVPSGGVI